MIRQFFLFFIIIFLGFSQTAFAQTADELRNKINEGNKTIDQLEAEIAAYRQELNKLGKESNTLKNSIKQLAINEKKLALQVKSTEAQINQSKLNIEDLELGINSKEHKINVNKASLASSLRILAELDAKTNLENFLSEEGFSNVWRDMENLKQVDSQVYRLISDLKEAKVDLEENKAKEEDEKARLESLKNRLSGEKSAVLANKSEKQNLLKITKNQESNYNKLLQEKIAKKEIVEKEMMDYESKLKYILDPSKLPGRGGLYWPLDNILITQRFGKTSDSRRLYTSGSHSGVDFRASLGTPVRAMASGVVAGTGDTDRTCPNASFGKWVLIKYDNGLASTYGHLSVISSTVGQRVSSNSVVAYSGNTGYSTAPHLHITAYPADAVSVANRPSKACGGKSYTVPVAATTAYLDVLDYLPTTTSNMYK